MVWWWLLALTIVPSSHRIASLCIAWHLIACRGNTGNATGPRVSRNASMTPEDGRELLHALQRFKRLEFLSIAGTRISCPTHGCLLLGTTELVVVGGGVVWWWMVLDVALGGGVAACRTNCRWLLPRPFDAWKRGGASDRGHGSSRQDAHA